ncbi:MAG: OmpA family protein [Prevotella sp.]|nr:OmpA family protein [Prevotella sp.]
MRFLSLCCLVALSFNVYSQDVRQDKQDNKARKIEVKADRKFVEQDFDKAMKLYESALKEVKTNTYTAVLHLKTARLYLTLLDYVSAIPHYDAAISSNENLFTSIDICNYLDALRYSGEKLKAIGIAREYAYRDVYKKDQRYLNILHALNYEDGFLPVGTPEFNIQKLDKFNTPYSEFWVGKMRNEYFYATSSSRFHDPNKKFYHRTRYYSLDENSEYSINSSQKGKSKPLLHMIPVDLQNGPLSFSDDMSKMIVTEVAYDKGESIEMSSDGVNTYKTKLRYSEYNKNRKGWSAFRAAFPQKERASYAHPFIFNRNRSVLFSSDMDGGYGGYDIYIVHWDEKLQSWGDPINLGEQVNTEGDEISPAIFNDMLVFSSNGHVGFGGYDIYGISYENGKILDGSLTHFDYPINTVLNDFSMLRIDKDKGYVISDRQRFNKDDIFYFERNKNFGSENLIYGMSEVDAITNGAIVLVNNEGNFNSPRRESVPKFSLESESLLSVYFDFDKSVLLPSAIQELKMWLAETDLHNIESLIIDGYADEMGTEAYNYDLSRRRAEVVAQWLSQQGIKARARVTGKGKIFVNSDSPLEVPFYNDNRNTSIWNHKIWMNRKARRVDIKAVIK